MLALFCFKELPKSTVKLLDQCRKLPPLPTNDIKEFFVVRLSVCFAEPVTHFRGRPKSVASSNVFGDFERSPRLGKGFNTLVHSEQAAIIPSEVPVQIERVPYFDWKFAVFSDGLTFCAGFNLVMEHGKTDQRHSVMLQRFALETRG